MTETTFPINLVMPRIGRSGVTAGRAREAGRWLVASAAGPADLNGG